jgi:hypothetical protein
MSDKIKVDGKEVSNEELNKLKEDQAKGKIKLKQKDKEGKEFKKLDKLLG